MIDPMTGLDDSQDPTKPKLKVGDIIHAPTGLQIGDEIRAPSDAAPVRKSVTGYGALDQQTGAPNDVRLAISAAGPNDRLAVAQKYLKNARMQNGVMIYDGPNGPALVEPRVLGNTNMKANLGNLLTAPGKLGSTLGMIAGGIAGTPADAVSGPAGTVVGAGLGAGLGGKAGRLVQKALAAIAGKPTIDTQTPGESLKETGSDMLTGATGEALGALGGVVAKGLANKAGRTVARAADAEASGGRLTAGQLLDSPIVKTLETANAVVPTGRGIMGRFGAEQSRLAGDQANHLAELIAGGGKVPSREEAGNLAIDAAKRAVETRAGHRATILKSLGDQHESMMSLLTGGTSLPSQEVANNSAQAIASRIGKSFEAERQPLFERAKLAINGGNPNGIDLPAVRAFVQEHTPMLGQESAAGEIQPAIDYATKLLNDAKGGKLDAGDLLRRRTVLGSTANYSSPLTAPDPGQTYLKKLFTAVRSDVQSAAEKGGAGALDALGKHDELVRGFRADHTPGGADFWGAVEDAKSPQAAFDMLTKHPNNAAALTAIQSRMTPQEIASVYPRHIANLSMTGGKFDADAFVKNWNGRGMSPDVQHALLGGNKDAVAAARMLEDHAPLAKPLDGTTQIERIANARTPSQAFDLTTNHPDNAAMLHQLRNIMGRDFDPIAARHFLDLGAGKAEGAFSPESFLTKFGGKSGMTPEVRQALYSGKEPMHPAVDAFERHLNDVASSASYRNPSGTAGMLQGTQALRDIIDGVVAQAAPTAALTHSPAKTAAALIGPMVTAKAFTSPVTVGAVSKLAKGTKVSGDAIADILKKLFPMGQP